MVKYIRAISPYTLFVFASAKLFLWSLGMIFLKSAFEMDIFSLSHFVITKYIMLAISLLGFITIKLKNYYLALFTSICFVFIWGYTTVGFGVNHGWYHSSNFLRNVTETAFIIYLYLRINKDRKVQNGA